MSELEKILEDSLARMTLGGESLEQVLARYPEIANELRPLLQTSQRVMSSAQNVTISSEFKERDRAALQAYMRAHPKKVAPRPKLVLRYAVGFAAVLLAFTSVTTAFAQNALPGQALYGWKLASERIWRAVHINAVYVDLELSNRRLQELLAVQNDPARVEAAFSAYSAALDTLKADLALIPTKALSARDVISAQKEAVGSLLDSTGRNIEDFFAILPTIDGFIEQNPDQEPAHTPQFQGPALITAVPPLGRGDNGGDTAASDEGGFIDDVKNAVDELLGLP